MKATSSTRSRVRTLTGRLRAVLLVAPTVAALGAGASAASAAGSAPYFAAAPALESARIQAAAAALPSGDVLIAGGTGTGPSSEKTAEIFDPARASFTKLGAEGEMHTGRSGALAAALPNGQVLVAGGFNSGVLQSAELFDPATDVFTAMLASGKTELQSPRQLAVAAPLQDGEVLIAGGSNTGVLKTAELFNPKEGTFTELAASGDMQVEREGAVAALLPNGEVLIAGGKNAGGSLKSAELFNPSTHTFTALAAVGSTELQVERSLAVAVLLPDGNVLIAGGTSGGAEKTAELFNPVTDTFTTLPATPDSELRHGRADAVAAPLPDGRVLIAGGTGGEAEKSAELFLSAPQATIAGGTFGDQTVSQPSTVSVVVLTNVGAQALSFGRVPLPTNGEFAITGETCAGRTLAFEQSCTISVRFTPAAAGAKTASIVVPDNEPGEHLTIELGGTGVAANAGPTGPTGPSGASGGQGATGAGGAAGPTGATGPAGQQGPSGQVILVTCTTTTKTVHHKPKKTTKCTSRPVPTPTTFTLTSIERAWLGRHGFLYASGTAEKGRVVLHARRALAAGRYTLTLVRGRGRHAVVHRTAVELP